MQIHIKGLPELTAGLANLPTFAKDELFKEIQVSTIKTHGEARKNAPVDTGRLRADIQFETVRSALLGVVYNTVFYAPFVHFGTSRMSANPYLFKAAESVQADHLVRLAEALERALEKAAK